MTAGLGCNAFSELIEQAPSITFYMIRASSDCGRSSFCERIEQALSIGFYMNRASSDCTGTGNACPGVLESGVRCWCIACSVQAWTLEAVQSCCLHSPVTPRLTSRRCQCHRVCDSLQANSVLHKVATRQANVSNTQACNTCMAAEVAGVSCVAAPALQVKALQGPVEVEVQ